MYWARAVLQFLEFFFEVKFFKKTLKEERQKLGQVSRMVLRKGFSFKKYEKVTAKTFLNHLSVTS